MRNYGFLSRAFVGNLVAIFFVMAGFCSAYAAEEVTDFMSDMKSAVDDNRKRVRLDEIDRDLRNQLINEYRSADFDEQKFFAKYVELIPPEAILDFLDREEPTCHRQAHELGRAIFRKFHDINEALRICGNSCTNACMHGAVGEAFADDITADEDMPHDHTYENDRHASTDELIGKMESFCRQDKMAHLHKRGNCAHAMGHAIMLVTDYDIGTSLAICSKFSEAGMDYYCATGVYMQYVDHVTANHSRKNDVERWGSTYPCNKYSAFPAACYRYIVSEVKEKYSLELEHVVPLCARLPDETRPGCFHGVGAAYTPLIKLHPELLKVVCSYGGKKEQTLCIEGAIEKLADFNEQWAIAACDKLDDYNANTCYAAARGKMYRLDKPSMSLYRTGIQR